MEDEYLIFGVHEGVHQVFWSQTRVDGVQDGTDARDAKVHLQVAVAIPLHHTYLGSLFHAESL